MNQFMAAMIIPVQDNVIMKNKYVHYSAQVVFILLSYLLGRTWGLKKGHSFIVYNGDYIEYLNTSRVKVWKEETSTEI